MAACGAKHTIALTTTGVWTWGQVGYGDNKNVLLPRCIRANARLGKVVTIAAGGDHSMAVTEDGDLFTWGGMLSHVIAPAAATQHTRARAHTHTCVRACTRTPGLSDYLAHIHMARG